MDILFLTALGLAGLIAGVMAGLLGIGGGIVIIPLLMYVVGLPVKTATGISIVQALFATLSGLVVHRRSRTVDVRLGIVLGAGGVLGSLAGALASAYVSDQVLTGVYLGVVALGIALLFSAPTGRQRSHYTVNPWLSFPIGLAVGTLSGMLGVGGGFIMTPLMVSVLKIPIRIAVGTSLLMILPTTISGSIAKIGLGQFDLQLGVPVIAGSIIGAQIGGRLNQRMTPRAVQATLLLLLVVIFLRTVWALVSA